MSRALTIFNRDIIPVYTTNEGKQIVIGRELHRCLHVRKDYSDWFRQMCSYGFAEGQDYFCFIPSSVTEKTGEDEHKCIFSQKREKLQSDVSKPIEVVFPQKGENSKSAQTPGKSEPNTNGKHPGGRPSRDHYLTFDMAKHIAMIQRTPEGFAIRQKLLELEERVRNQMVALPRDLPSALRRLADTEEQNQALRCANNRLHSEVQTMEHEIGLMVDKADFCDTLQNTTNLFSMKELSVYLTQNGVALGRTRLMEQIRKDGYLCKGGQYRNSPSQFSIDMGLLIGSMTTYKEGRKVIHYTSPKATAKGFEYFLRKYGAVKEHHAEDIAKLRAEAVKGLPEPNKKLLPKPEPPKNLYGSIDF